MLRNTLLKKITASVLVMSFVFSPAVTLAIDIYDPKMDEPNSSGAVDTSYTDALNTYTDQNGDSTMSSNYSGVSDISKATNDPAASKSLTSCSKAVPAAQRAVLGLQLAKVDPTKNDTLLTIFDNIPALVGGYKAIDNAYVKNSKDETVLSDDAKKQWRTFLGGLANTATFGIYGKSQTKKAEAAGDTDRLTELKEQETFRTECLDSIKIAIAKNLLDRGTNEMVSLIQTGKFGDPMYVTDGKEWYRQLQDQTIVSIFGDDLRNRENGLELSSPYALRTIRGIVESTRDKSFQERTKYTLSGVLLGLQNRYGTGNGSDNIKVDIKTSSKLAKEYSNNFSLGGWEAWFALTQNSANNPIGYGIMAQEELSRRQAEEEKAITAENNGQLLSAKVCTSYIGEDGKTYNKKTLNVKPTDTKNCLKSEVVTPGSLITERMKWFLTSDIRQLELADKFNSSISQILTASINKATQIGLDAIKTKVSSNWSTSGSSSSLAQYAQNRQSFLGGGNKTRVSYKGTSYDLFLDTNSSYWKDSLNLERDLNDVQVGCEVKKGLYTTQKEYVEELEYMIDPNQSPLPKVIPYVALLDMCVPGPTAVWQDLSDPAFADFMEAVSTDDSNNLGSPDLAFTKVKDTMEKRTKTAGTLNTFGSITSTVGPVLPPPANGIAMIVGAGLNISSAIVKNRRIEGLKPGDYSAAIGAFQQYVPMALEQEINKQKEDEINSTINAYERMVDYLYTTYSDKNNLPVAAKARPVIGNLIEKDENIKATITAYNAEYQSASAVLKELEDIKKQVDSIYATATKRMEAKYDVKDSSGKTIQKWNDVPAICTQSCTIVKKPEPKPTFDSVNMLLKGLKLQNGVWTTGTSIKDLITGVKGDQLIDQSIDKNLFKNIVSGGTNTGSGTNTGTGTNTGNTSGNTGISNPGSYTFVTYPTINSFSADDAIINYGESTNLSWDVSNATSVMIKNSSTGTIIKTTNSLKDTLAVYPKSTTTYVLFVENANGESQKDFKITVVR